MPVAPIFPMTSLPADRLGEAAKASIFTSAAEPARCALCAGMARHRAHEIATDSVCKRQRSEIADDHEGVGFQLADNRLTKRRLMDDWCRTLDRDRSPTKFDDKSCIRRHLFRGRMLRTLRAEPVLHRPIVSGFRNGAFLAMITD